MALNSKGTLPLRVAGGGSFEGQLKRKEKYYVVNSGIKKDR